MKRLLTMAALLTLALAAPSAKADYHDTYRAWRDTQNGRDWNKMDEYRGWLAWQHQREWPTYYEGTRMTFRFQPAAYRPGVFVVPVTQRAVPETPDREVFLRAYDASRAPLPYRLRGR